MNNYETKVTGVQVYPFKEGANLGKIKALATVVLNDAFTIRGLRIIEGENELSLSYPVDPFYKGEEFRFIAFPVEMQLKQEIERAVISKYKVMMEL